LPSVFVQPANPLAPRLRDHGRARLKLGGINFSISLRPKNCTTPNKKSNRRQYQSKRESPPEHDTSTKYCSTLSDRRFKRTIYHGDMQLIKNPHGRPLFFLLLKPERKLELPAVFESSDDIMMRDFFQMRKHRPSEFSIEGRTVFLAY